MLGTTDPHQLFRLGTSRPGSCTANIQLLISRERSQNGKGLFDAFLHQDIACSELSLISVHYQKYYKNIFRHEMYVDHPLGNEHKPLMING